MRFVVDAGTLLHLLAEDIEIFRNGPGQRPEFGTVRIRFADWRERRLESQKSAKKTGR